MATLVGNIAPNFLGISTTGEIELHPWLGTDWGLLIVCPRAFDPEATELLSALVDASPCLETRHVRLIAVVCGPTLQQLEWRNQLGQAISASLEIPLVADEERGIAGAYGVRLDERAGAALFLIDQEKRVCAQWQQHEQRARTGKEMASTVLRLVDALAKGNY